jgi:O-antigen biosynthesis protein WbqP
MPCLDTAQKNKNNNSQLPKDKTSQKYLQLLLKRLTDIAIAIVALFLLAPFMLLIPLAIRLGSKGPAIFRQKRIGKNGEIFEIFKYRTMLIDTPDLPTGEMLQVADAYITPVGKILRKTSLDELPQLFNVLKGNMSISGPRPALWNQVELTAKRLKLKILEFPPGITGWAQINGRDDLPDDKKIELDKWYCDNWNYFLDWKIIAFTFITVINKRGAN